MPCSTPPSRPGFTALDLLVTLAVAAVLLTAGVPGLRHVLLEARLGAATNDFVHAVHLARQAAQTRARPVVLCPTAGDGRCLDRRRADWARGWMVFVNEDGDEPPHRDRDEPVLSRHGGLAPLHASANRRAFTFRPFSARDTNGTWMLCTRAGGPAHRQVVVSPTGRPRNASGDSNNTESRCY